MIISPSIVSAAKAAGESNTGGQFVPEGGVPISAAAVVDLLVDSTSPRAQPGARKLLRDMAGLPWRVIAPAHPSPDDQTPHITIRVHALDYHLRLDGQGCIFDITATKKNGQRLRPAGSKPWVGPGA